MQELTEVSQKLLQNNKFFREFLVILGRSVKLFLSVVAQFWYYQLDECLEPMNHWAYISAGHAPRSPRGMRWQQR